MTKQYENTFTKDFDFGNFHVKAKMVYNAPSHFDKLKQNRNKDEDLALYLGRVLPFAYDMVTSVEIKVYKKKKKGKGEKEPDYSKDDPVQIITDKEEILHSEISSEIINYYYADWSTGIPLGKTTAV